MSGLASPHSGAPSRIYPPFRVISAAAPPDLIWNQKGSEEAGQPVRLHSTADGPRMDQHDAPSGKRNPKGSPEEHAKERRRVAVPAELPIGRLTGFLYRLFGGDPEAKKAQYRQVLDEYIAETGKMPEFVYLGDSLLLDEDPNA